jgi:hypothetical protein
MPDTAPGGVADREGCGLAPVPSAAVQLEQLLGRSDRATEGTDYIGIMDSALDRREIPFVRRPQADDAVGKWRIRNRERGDDDRSRSAFCDAGCVVSTPGAVPGSLRAVASS